MLVDLANELLAEARMVEPSTRLVLLGGANLRGLVERVEWMEWRPPQGFYEEDRFTPILAPLRGHLGRMTVKPERRPPCLAEITGWPRNAFAKSWRTFELQVTLSAFLGFDAALFWAGIGYRERRFAEFAKANRAWLDFVREVATAHPRMVGLAAPVDRDRPRLSKGLISLARMGFALNPIPIDELDAQSTVALCETPSLSEEFPLSGQPAILDQGTLRNNREILASHFTLQPSEVMFSAERMTEDYLNGKGAGLYSTSLTFLKDDDMQLIDAAKPLHVLSHYIDGQSRPITPCVAIDEERRWLILNKSPAAWERLISWFKAGQLRNAIEHVHGGALPVMVIGGIDTFVFARETNAHRSVLVMNLSMDAIGRWQLKMDRPVKSSFVANERCEWKSLADNQCPSRTPQHGLPPRTARLYRFELE